MNDKMLAGYQRARNKANHRRENPSRKEMSLRTAIRRLGFPVTGYEWEAHDTDTNRSMWFDVAYNYNNQLMLVDLKPLATYQSRQVTKYKRQYTDKYKIPWLVVQAGTVAEIQAQIIQYHQQRRWTE
jgi:hypothetical protein